MASILTRYFGAVEYEPAEILDFPHGLPGFPEQRSFLLIQSQDQAPLHHLQSLSTPELCFLVLPVSQLDAHYELAITTEDRQALGLFPDQPLQECDLSSFVILAKAKNGRVTANLLAPVVINAARGRGAQAVRTDARYSHQHPLEASSERPADECRKAREETRCW